MVEMLSVTKTVMVQLHAMIKPIMSETGSMDETGRALLEGLAFAFALTFTFSTVGFKVLGAVFSCTDL